jgi:hypothetical protein
MGLRSRPLGIAIVFCVSGAAQVASAQQSCEAPCYLPPSCVAPSCAAPGCAAPRECCGTCGKKCEACCKHCCGPRKIVYKRSFNGGGTGLFGAEPPRGIVVSSVAALNLNTPTISLQSGRGISEDDLEDRIRDLERQSRSAANTRGTSNADETCETPCADIKQLQAEVRHLTRITSELTENMRVLATERAANQQPAVP